MNDRIATCLGVALLVLAYGTQVRAASDPPLTTLAGVVASDSRDASNVGANVLAQGGNAVDAAIATALALGVVHPNSSGLGGGGFALVFIAAENKTYALDFRETAPRLLSPASFVTEGKLDPALSQAGGLAVGIPGEVAGLELLSKRFGALSWPSVVLPAETMARDGFLLDWFLAHSANIVANRLASQASTNPLLAWLRPHGKPMVANTWARRTALAGVLKTLRTRGARGFYRGRVAREIVDAITGARGVMTLDDLANYAVVERTPLSGTWNGYRIDTMPLPSSGGLALLEMLGILEATRLDVSAMGAGSSSALHITAEVLKHAFADRARYLGDVGSAGQMTARLLDPVRLVRLARRVSRNRVQRHTAYGDRNLALASPPKDDRGTTHLCAVDRHGNAVSLTTTVNGYFGAKVLAAGIVLNNQMDDFSLRSGQPNMFGLVQSDANLVGPGKRPLSSMTPTLVFKDSKVVGCLGGSGGPRIISNTFQVLLNRFGFGMNASEAVSAPRIHHQWLPKKLLVEAGIPRDVVDGLKRRGQTTALTTAITAVQAVFVRPDGTREAASDPRKGGAPAVE